MIPNSLVLSLMYYSKKKNQGVKTVNKQSKSESEPESESESESESFEYIYIYIRGKNTQTIVQ